MRSLWPRSFAVFLLLAALLSPASSVARADDWPQWLGPRRDGVWRETGIVDKFSKGGPKVLWRKEIGPGYTGPAVADGRVFVMDRPWPGGGKLDDTEPMENPPKTERVLCFSAADGKLLWKHEYDCKYAGISYATGPRTTPLVHKGKVYTLGAMGNLFCLDVAKGKVLWSKDFRKVYKARPPVWGWSAHPLLDGQRLICLVGGDDHAVVAFDKDNGKEKWHALTSQEVCYAPPMIYKAGGKRQLIIWLSDSVNSLNPETGKEYWSQEYPVGKEVRRPAVSIATPRLEGDLLLVTSFYHGSLMLKLAADKPAAKVLWHGKSNQPGPKSEALHALHTTPVIQDGYIYGMCGLGELRCLKAATGKRLWETYKAIAGKKALFGTAFLVRQRDRYFLFNDQGDLIIARLTPKGYTEIDRANLLKPTQTAQGRDVVWSHPAFANRCVFARNDKEIVCVSLAKK
jgi:outer membrane protein assembly factor BamB